MTRVRVRRLAVAEAISVLALVFAAIVRPWYLRWGATDADLVRMLPGDEISRSGSGPISAVV